VDTTVNPLFCGGCNSRCPFDRFGATTCGEFGNGVNATAASCKVTCSPSYPTQCGTIANYNASSATRPPTSNCVNTNQDVNNCGGVRIFSRFYSSVLLLLLLLLLLFFSFFFFFFFFFFFSFFFFFFFFFFYFSFFFFFFFFFSFFFFSLFRRSHFSLFPKPSSNPLKNKNTPPPRKTPNRERSAAYGARRRPGRSPRARSAPSRASPPASRPAPSA